MRRLRVASARGLAAGHVAARVVGVASLALTGWSRPLAAQERSLTVFAAASLTEAFTEAGRIFESREPGLEIRFNFAGSQQLALQIKEGAAADVFASADERWMSTARDRGLVSDDSREFARNRLVAIVPTANPGRVDRLQDLGKRGLKIVLAAEAVPAGKYAREALRKLATAPGLGADYERRVLANVVSDEENVKAVVAKVQLGEADAGIVYRSDITAAVARAVRMLEIPKAYNVIATYPIAVLKDARNPMAARAFVAFLLSGEGQALLERHGLLRNTEPVSATVDSVRR